MAIRTYDAGKINLVLALGAIAAMSLRLLVGHTLTSYEIGTCWFLIGVNLGVWSTHRIRDNIERSYTSSQAQDPSEGQ